MNEPETSAPLPIRSSRLQRALHWLAVGLVVAGGCVLLAFFVAVIVIAG